MGEGRRPTALQWRSHTVFIVATVAIGLFTDLFLYGLIVPVLPFMLQDRLNLPDTQVQNYTSGLLAAYAGASVLFSLPAGWVADRTSGRQIPFLTGLAALLAATVMLALGRTVAVLVTARVLQGISAAVVWTVGLAMVLDTVGPKHLGTVIGSMFSFISVGTLAAPVLGGILYSKTGYVGIFTVGAGLLTLDFIMRLVVVEKSVAARFDIDGASTHPRDHESRSDGAEGDHADEQSTLLGESVEEDFLIPEGQNRVVRSLPILYCLSNVRVATALWVGFVQAALLGMFDATIPTEAKSLLGFNSMEAGLLFIALDVPYLLLGPVAGWAVDKYGTKPAAVLGFTYLVPVLALLRLPSAGVVHTNQDTIIIWCVMLAFNGIGLAIIGSPSIVEASDVVQRYEKANKGFFGANGPYAQLYGCQSMTFSAGLTLGPLLSGALRETVGYGNMNAVFAAMASLTALLSFLFIGGRPKRLRKVAPQHV